MSGRCDTDHCRTAARGATLAGIAGALRAFWRGVRTATGDDAYERYLRHQADMHPGTEPLSRRDFFVAEQQRKWSGINRCC